MNVDLCLRLLGAVQVEREGQPVPELQSGLRLALLGYLVAQREPLPREHLADLFWQDLPAERGRANLSWTVHKLSAALPGCLQADRHTVGFQVPEGCWIDARQFDACVFEARAGEGDLVSLAEAAALYRGAFLEGLSLHNCADYELWLVGERERWRRRVEQVLNTLIARHGERGGRVEALRYARRLLELAPWREETHRHVMRLLAESGQRGAALAQYEACRRVLEEELSVEPGEETTRLYRQIRDGELPSQAGDAARLSSPPERGPWHSLPAQSTPFIGREAQLSEVRALLARPEVRLLTLTGAGGTGKTRLALQVAAGLLDVYRDGAVFVPLAPLRDPGLVPSAIAETLGVKESPDSTLLEALQYVLRERETLLVLDNYEHVADAAPVVSALLAAAPGLKTLVTSRVPLHLYPEHVYAVPPMAIPEGDELPPVERLARVEAVQLFVQRAQQAEPGFTLCSENAQAVSEVCARLDGLPLAVELAAARTRLLSPQKMLPHLDGALRFLTGGPRDLPARQRTLRATIDWSHALLDDDERALFRRLAAFHGGCSLEAVEAVCGVSWPAASPPPALDLLESLTDQNLVQAAEVEGETRFFMLETVREYAVEQLDASAAGEAGATRMRHARYYRALAEEIDPGVPTLGSPRADQLAWELDNLRAALAWSLAHAPEVGVRLAGALAWFWESRAYVSEGRVWLDKALAASRARGAADRWHAQALVWAGWLASRQSEQQGVEELLAEGVDLWRQLGEPRELGRALMAVVMGVPGLEPDRARVLAEEIVTLYDSVGAKAHLAVGHAVQASVARAAGDRERALACSQVSIDIVRQVEGTSNPILAWPRSVRGQVLLALGDYATARPWFEQAVAIQRVVEHKPGIANALYRLGDCWYLDDDCARARECYTESLALKRAAGQRGTVATLFGRLGHVALCRREWDEARSHLAEALALFQETGRTGSRDAVGALVGWAGLAQAEGQPVRAACLLGTAAALLGAAGGALTPVYVPVRDRLDAVLRAEMEEAAFSAAWREGEVMGADGAERVVAYALGGKDGRQRV
jgi:predicted ATPase/DNA-binding SARP family transcriptional activator